MAKGKWVYLVKERSEIVTEDVRTAQRALSRHPVYSYVTSPSALQTFMEHHVFAVWDFMSLVKALQAQLTCTSVPWTPRKHGRLGRFINEIVLGEESDVVGGREPTSHFELYLEAMDAVGANTGPIRHFVDAVDAGQPVEDALESAGAPPAAASFVRRTFDVIERGSVPEIASEFAIAREKVIPSMFRALIGRLEIGHRLNVAPLIEYLERHVELDGDEHGPLADELLETVCHEDNEKRFSAQQSALDALAARHRLWDEIATILKSKGEAPIAVETVVRGDLASKPEKFWMQIIGVVSVTICAAVAFLIYGPRPEGLSGQVDVSTLPLVNSILNTITAVLLVGGVWLVKKGNIAAHRKVMLTAFGTSTMFLVTYVIYHWFRDGHQRYDGPMRELYLVILVTHILLAVAVLPLALTTLYRGWVMDRARHRKIARIAFPIWLYVSVTGVLIYVMAHGEANTNKNNGEKDVTRAGMVLP